ncbi:hypothetical protein BD410DRAFT_787487 [Rickenella mellea]|uniref:Aminoglycoside phosphotransferase domain-containing protein n=1 Tax=Rickenella mellea TaxID=50990 RepID=A0A4Y7Q6H9_9AGAM|nr:hypothetical protein BD410DRAFT_787487 [Rickenella mellea]
MDLSEESALDVAQQIAHASCEAHPVSARMRPFQDLGSSSKSILVSLSDGTDVVVQLRDTEIDTSAVALANTLLGDVVPLSRAAKTSAVQAAYIYPSIGGKLWTENEVPLEGDVSIASQLASLLARLALPMESTSMIDRVVVPRLRRIVAKEHIPSDELKQRIDDMVHTTEHLRALPLAICPSDLDPSHVVIDEDFNVTGLINWETTTLLPLGMSAWAIHPLSTSNKGGVDILLEKTKPMAEAFWKEFVANMPHHLQAHQRTLIDAMEIGLVFSAFPEGKETSEDAIRLLPTRLEWLRDTFEPLCRTPLERIVED